MTGRPSGTSIRPPRDAPVPPLAAADRLWEHALLHLLMSSMLQSYWMRTALAENDELSAPLDGDTHADVCIVGGGFTGLWTAIALKESDPGLDVVVLEARHCGSGASGANAGYMVPYWSHIAVFEALAGLDEALRLCHAAANASEEILAFAERNGIDPEAQRNGAVWGSTCTAQTGHWDEALSRLDELQLHPFTPLDPDEIAARTGVSGFIDGVLEHNGVTIMPGKLVRGLRTAALSLGVRIYENTPMTGLGRERKPLAHTASGTVSAENIVLALYAWSLNIPELKDSLAAIRSDGLITEPQPERIEAVGWTNGPAIMTSHHFTEACRTTRDGRVLFNKPGGGQVFAGRVDASLNTTSRRSEFMRNRLRHYYPSLGAAPVAAHWTGSIDRTRIGLPMFGQLPGQARTFYGFGYSGRGIVPAYIGGQILTDLVLHGGREWQHCPLRRVPGRHFPPEPVKYFGGALVRRAIERADRLDHEQTSHDAVTRALLKLKPGHWSRQK